MVKVYIKEKKEKPKKVEKKIEVDKKPEAKRLYRSKEHKIIAGVLGGLAEYMNTSPALLRVLFIILLIFTGFWPGLIVYLVCWIIIPKKK